MHRLSADQGNILSEALMAGEHPPEPRADGRVRHRGRSHRGRWSRCGDQSLRPGRTPDRAFRLHDLDREAVPDIETRLPGPVSGRSSSEAVRLRRPRCQSPGRVSPDHGGLSKALERRCRTTPRPAVMETNPGPIGSGRAPAPGLSTSSGGPGSQGDERRRARRRDSRRKPRTRARRGPGRRR